MHFSDNMLARVREENPIETVIAEFLDLKKAGKNYKALCPFHTEKMPSFSVSPERGIYHCFGCGKSGNVLTFLMEYKGMTFPEAVRFLAERAGIEIEGEKEKNRDVLMTLEFAKSLYHKTLLSKPQGTLGLAYFEKRGIKRETIDRFSLGYAPMTRTYLIEMAEKEGIGERLLERAGLITEGRDKFIKRIMFPVFNLSRKVIGFTSRVIDDGVPVYMNSPETEVYKKSETLYGLYQAKGEIRKENLAFLVEGSLDLLSVWQAGVGNVVASLGTSLTERQAGVLSRYAKEVVIFYDSDDAGMNATRRAINILLKNAVSVKTIVLPSGYDPDLYVREKGVEYKKLLKGSIDFLQFIIDSKEITTADEKIALLGEIKETLSLIKDPLMREVWTDEAAKRFSISSSLLLNKRKTEIVSPKKTSARVRVETGLLGLALKRTNIWKLTRDNIEIIQSQTIKEILKMDTVSSDEIMDRIEPDLRESIGTILFRKMEEAEEMEEAESLLQKLRRWEARENRKGMIEKIRKLEMEGEDVSQLLLKYQDMKVD